jgi:EmrB/QacA subfamily drug resistance transporter
MADKIASAQHERRWLILALLGVSQLMVVLDATIVNIALPSAQHSLGFSNDSRQWVVTAYALAFGSLLLIGGRIGDFFGRKRALMIGLGGFATASAIAGLAQSFEVLVGARALQGAFGALLAPSALSILTTTFTDPAERGKAFGIFGAIAGGGGAIGLLLGGILTEYLDWRWTLFVNLIFAVPAAMAAMVLLVNQRPSVRPKLDIPGAVAAVTGLFALVYGFANAETHGWGAPLTIGALAAGTVLLSLFVTLQARGKHPLLPLRVVLDRDRGGSYAAMAISGAGMFGVFLFLTYYLQRTLGFSPVKTGLAFLPMMAAIISSATLVSGFVLPRTGPRPLVPTGMILAGTAMLLLTGIGSHTGYASHVLPELLLMGAGMGLIFAPAMATATGHVAHRDAGVASAMVNTSQQVGGSIGTALLSTFAATAVTGYVGSHGGPSPSVLSAAAVHGYTTAFTWSAGFFFVGALISLLLLRSGVQEPELPDQPQAADEHELSLERELGSEPALAY